MNCVEEYKALYMKSPVDDNLINTGKILPVLVSPFCLYHSVPNVLAL